jgi:hypothetical protein
LSNALKSGNFWANKVVVIHHRSVAVCFTQIDLPPQEVDFLHSGVDKPESTIPDRSVPLRIVYAFLQPSRPSAFVNHGHLRRYRFAQAPRGTQGGARSAKEYYSGLGTRQGFVHRSPPGLFR